MKVTQNLYDKILTVFKVAHREKARPAVAGSWQQDVMRDIRRQPVEVPEPGDIWVIGLWFWRLAPVTCLLIVIAATLLASQDVIPQYEMATLLMDDPIDSTYVQGMQIL